MQYPITPDYIKNAPASIERLYRNLEAWILQDIAERFKLSDKATSTAIEHIRMLQRRGYSYDDIKKYITATLKLTSAEYDKIMQKAISDNRQYYASTLTEDVLMRTAFDSVAMQKEIAAIVEQTKGNLDNLTQSLGFSMNVNGQRVYLPIAKAYQRILSDAEIKVWSGAQSYSEAIRGAIGQLTQSGLQTVTWANNGTVYHIDHADVAARRAVMTGITQLSSKYSEQARKEVPTEYIEISAHVGARDKDVNGRPWANHKKWQGKVYSTKDGDKYPNIYTECGWGEVDGLEGANCRHMHFPFWDGISERTYTDEQLANIDPKPFTFQNHTYNAYAATQKQRQIERALRKVKRDMLAYEAAGDKEAYRNASIRYIRLNQQYKDFCKAGNLRSQAERGNIAEFGPQDAKKAISVVAQRT